MELYVVLTVILINDTCSKPISKIKLNSYFYAKM